MATTQTALVLDHSLLARLDQARAHTDGMFRSLPLDSYYERPIPERHRLIFYLGHLEAFDWNLLAPVLGLRSHEAELDKLFAFGIDPVGGGLPTDVPGDWPALARVEGYRDEVRRRLSEALRAPRVDPQAAALLLDGTLLHVAIEHRLMHAETLAYLWHNLPVSKKGPGVAEGDSTPAPAPRVVDIPEGIATLGQCRSGAQFGWDNEFEAQQADVPSFSVDVFPVTNSEYLRFVQAGGYADPRYWSAADWEWRSSEKLEHPGFWEKPEGASATDPNTAWRYRAMFGSIPLPPSWPVYVSHAEATAYAKWAGKKLPTEAQWQRAA